MPQISPSPLDSVGEALACGCGYVDPNEPELGGCVCPSVERALRAFMERRPGTPAAMTPDQRAWCLAEIGSVEGYVRADYEDVADSALARGVLNAWTDYARDKGALR